MYSSHVFGINSKPFNSKTNGVLKRRILELFLLCNDKNSKYFTKYGARIADELYMEFQTGEDRQRIFDVLPNVKSKAPRSEDIPHASCWSFVAAPPESKAGSWFAWNLAA